MAKLIQERPPTHETEKYEREKRTEEKGRGAKWKRKLKREKRQVKRIKKKIANTIGGQDYKQQGQEVIGQNEKDWRENCLIWCIYHREIEALHTELADLSAVAAKTNQKLEYRTKQFQLLLHALQDLQTDLLLEKEKEKDDTTAQNEGSLQN